jgi:uncharacterized membrane protein
MVSISPLPATPPKLEIVLPEVGVGQCLVWLKSGWRDLCRCPAVGFAHGIVMALFGAAIFGFAPHRFWLLAGAFSGFMLVAPVLATGLYAVSRALENGSRADFRTVREAWQSGDRRQMVFGVLLALAGTGWVLTSAAMITVWAPQPVNEPADFLRHVLLGDTWLFETWVVLGGVLAAPVFASSVIAMPMLLDRDVGVLEAVLTSWRVVMTNPLPMAAWATVIMLLTGIGMATGLLGLIVLMPLMGHASWHAYRDLVKDAGSK